MAGTISDSAPRRDLGLNDITQLLGYAESEFDEADAQAFANGEAEFFVLGRIEYWDAFGRARWTDFRYRGFPDKDVIRWETCAEGNESN